MNDTLRILIIVPLQIIYAICIVLATEGRIMMIELPERKKELQGGVTAFFIAGMITNITSFLFAFHIL